MGTDKFGYENLLVQQLTLEIGEAILVAFFNVGITDIFEHQDELSEQKIADGMGLGINGN